MCYKENHFKLVDLTYILRHCYIRCYQSSLDTNVGAIIEYCCCLTHQNDNLNFKINNLVVVKWMLPPTAEQRRYYLLKARVLVWCLLSLLIWSNHEVGQFLRIEIWRRAEVVARLEDGGQEEVAPPGQEAANFFFILNSGDAELLPLPPLLTCWCESGFHSWTASRWILTPALILTADSESDPLSLRRVSLQTCSRCRSAAAPPRVQVIAAALQSQYSGCGW